MAYRIGKATNPATAQPGLGTYNPRSGEMAYGAAKSVARGAENLGDLPGNVGNALLTRLGDLLTGQNVGQKIREQQQPQQSNVDFFSDLIAGKGYGNPQSKFEQYGQKALEEVIPTLALGAGSKARNLAYLAGTNALSSGLQEGLNIPEKYAEGAKITAQLLRNPIAKFQPDAVKNFIGKGMQKFEELIPRSVNGASKNLQTTLNSVGNTLGERVASNVDKRVVNDVLRTIEKNAAGGTINISKIPDLTKDINDIIYDHKTVPLVKHLLGKVKNSLNETFKDFVGKNPQYKDAYKYYNDLKETWGALANESNTTKWFNKLTNFENKYGLGKVASKAIPYIPGAGITKGVIEAGELLGKSSGVRRVLGNIALESAKEVGQNAAAHLPTKLSHSQRASTTRPQGKYRLSRSK